MTYLLIAASHDALAANEYRSARILRTDANWRRAGLRGSRPITSAITTLTHEGAAEVAAAEAAENQINRLGISGLK